MLAALPYFAVLRVAICGVVEKWTVRVQYAGFVIRILWERMVQVAVNSRVRRILRRSLNPHGGQRRDFTVTTG